VNTTLNFHQEQINFCNKKTRIKNK